MGHARSRFLPVLNGHGDRCAEADGLRIPGIHRRTTGSGCPLIEVQMPQSASHARTTAEARGSDFYVAVVGAGFAGMYLLHRLRGLGLAAIVF